MENFTPVSAAIGGVMIGLSAALLWLANGRIAGISGIVGSLWTPRANDIAWRIAFIGGLIVAPVLYRMLGGALPKITIDAPWAIVVAAGLLVGFGTRLGSGCTSGHGVCGMARLSRRSLTATAIFMAAGIATRFALRHLVGV
ncbi:MAG TPA: YeeE/YedE family protein [Stellaceae bacterium]|nr:YeeE/YedE family protein [Stellaceae bacterium]